MITANQPPVRRFRWPSAVFWLCGGLKLLVLSWLACHAFPRNTADEAALLQPAYLHVFTGNYPVPTYAGRMPYTDLLYAWYNPLHVMLNAAWFRFVCFSLWNSLAADVAVLLILSGILAGIVWRLTQSGWLSGMYWLGTTYLISPVGRQEELALLFGLLGVLAAGPTIKRWWASVLLLAAAGAVSTLTAVLSTVLAVIRIGLATGWRQPFARRACGLLLLAPAVSLAIFLWHVQPYFRQAWEQVKIGAQWAASYRETGYQSLVSLNPFGTASLLIFGSLAIASMVRLQAWQRDGHFAGGHLPAARWLLGVLCAGVVLAQIMGRPSYDYRWLRYLLPALVIVLARDMAQTVWSGQGSRWKSALAGSCLVVALALPNRDIVRYSLAPWLWISEGVTFSDAAARINRIVPKDASIGGDAALWTAVTDGRPFLAIRWVAPQFWPDYVVSTSISGPEPYVFEHAEWRDHLATEYDEIPLAWPPASRHDLRVGPWRVSIFHGESDWRFRLWKRKTSSRLGGS